MRSSESKVVRSPNFSARKERIKALVFHYTEMKTAAEALERLTSKRSEVSAHYLIDEAGALYSLVDESCVAWHAGESYWRGREAINCLSIGVELANPGLSWGYEPFGEAQMATCIRLARELLARHRIAESWILAHSDIAPRRKRDPGSLFDWRLLAKNHIGFYPQRVKPSAKLGEAKVKSLLAQIGYELVDWRLSLGAFQRRWRQAQVDCSADAETCGLLKAVADRYGGGRRTSR